MTLTALYVLAALLYQPAPGEDPATTEAKMVAEVDAVYVLGWGIDCKEATGDPSYHRDAPFLAIANLKAAGHDEQLIAAFRSKYKPKFEAEGFRKADVTPAACQKYFGHMRGLHPGYDKLSSEW